MLIWLSEAFKSIWSDGSLEWISYEERFKIQGQVVEGILLWILQGIWFLRQPKGKENEEKGREKGLYRLVFWEEIHTVTKIVHGFWENEV